MRATVKAVVTVALTTLINQVKTNMEITIAAMVKIKLIGSST